MFKSIYVPVDNSEYSNQASNIALTIAKAFGAKLTGSHVYAATMHDYRFKQMEFTLPAEYLQEQEIERQRKIHDSLITMGLELISDCYLDPLDKACKQEGLTFKRRMMDGKHYNEILKDIETADYDLTILGVLGSGKTRDSQIGTVCERVSRHSVKDVLVVKNLPKDDDPPRDTILVGIDGSPQSFGGLMTAIELAKKLDKRLDLISVYDPYLHYVVFKNIVDVLNEKAAKVFRFEEQNQLHEEIIDTGLAQIYQSHLNVAESIARDQGVSDVSKTLLDGKAFQKILNHARKTDPWLLIIGRIGVHSALGEKQLGSNTENLLRMCPCDILINSQLEYPQLDLKAEESVLWTPESEERMLKVPEMVRGIARTAILRLAVEQGHSVVTDSLIQEAMDRFMPKRAAELTTKYASALAIEHARNNKTHMCKRCGVTSREDNPVKCSVCGDNDFEVISQEVIEKLAESQGGIEEEETYDGKKLRWSSDARKDLNSIEDKYIKRRAKARIEKAARSKRLDVITQGFAKTVIDEEVGLESIKLNGKSENTTQEAKKNGVAKALDLQADLKLVATDSHGVEFRSTFTWTEDAQARILRIPAGFMRDKNQERAEKIALDRKLETVDLKAVEAGIEVGQKLMQEVLDNAIQGKQVSSEAKDPAAKCPFQSYFSASSEEQKVLKDALQKVKQSYGPEPVKTNTTSGFTVEEVLGSKDAVKGNVTSNVFGGSVKTVLNETGVMAEFEKRRRELAES